nr:MAG TPA: Portal [Caudoviricetes sp.]
MPTHQNPNFADKGQIRLRSDDVLHIPGLGFDGLVGYSPIAMAKNAIGITLATEEYGAAFFKNGARPGGVLEHPGVLKDPSKLRESWHAVYGGTMNTGRIAVLEAGVNYQQIAIPPEEVQSLGTRKFEIARLYRVPACMAAILEKSSFNERHPLSYPIEAEEGESSILLTRIFLNSRRVTRSRWSCSTRRFHGEWISRNS